MSLERITFEGPVSDYHAYDYSEHYLRYGLFREICAGKRVLDVACGAGYGSYLLASWGAQEVIAVDLSAEAITEARRVFGHDRITFIQGNVEELDKLVQGQFDLIVSFETIEHLKLPRLFLEHISHLRTAVGIVAISAPNDAGVLRAGEPNRFHLHRFSFDEFRALSNCILGEASSWALAFPAQGTLLVDAAAFSGMPAAHSALGALERQIGCTTDVLAAQANCAPSAATSAFYIGIWGRAGINRAAISPMTVASFKEPWWLLSDLRAEVAHLEAEISDLTTTLDAERQNHAHAANDLRAEVARLAAEISDLTTTLDAERQNHAHAANHLRAEVARLAAEISDLTTTLDAERQDHAHAANDLRRTQIEMSEVSDNLRRTQAALDTIQQSTVWRSTAILRHSIGRLSPRTRSAMRGVLRGAYWLITPHLWRRRYAYFLARRVVTLDPSNQGHQDVSPIEREPALPPWAIEIMREIGLEQDRAVYPTAALLEQFTVYSPYPDVNFARLYVRLAVFVGTGYTHCFVLPWIKRGGADLAALHYIRAVSENPQAKVLVILTENADSPWLNRLPPSVTAVELSKHIGDIGLEATVVILTRLLVQIAPTVIHNINSHHGWQAFRKNGRALRCHSRLYASLFCYDYDQNGLPVGYPEVLPHCYQYLCNVLSDNASFPRALQQRFGYVPELFKVTYLPTEIPEEPLLRDVRPQRRILWAGRPDRQKRIDLLARIAERIPTCTFLVFGSALLDASPEVARLSDLANVELRGPFDGFGNLPTSDCDLLLYTSGWDGLPNILLEAAARGLPIVAGDVGGIHELIDDETGYLVKPFDDVDSYVAIISRVLAECWQEALARGRRARARAATRHSFTAFQEELGKIDGYLDVHSHLTAQGHLEATDITLT